MTDIDPKVAANLTKMLLAEAEVARGDLAAFFDFTMREEISQKSLKAAPHQRLIFEFIQAHKQCVLRLPVGASKTFSLATVTLHLLGRDPTERGVILSATQGQAQKPLKMVADYIEQPELSSKLHLVFPELKRSERPADPWTQTMLTVKRPAGIRDASLYAVGEDGGLPGARLSWIIVDDILNRENTATKLARQKTIEFFDSTVRTRLDPGGRIVVSNTPWAPDDLTFYLENEVRWPTLTMDVMGGIKLTNVDYDWDSREIRPASAWKDHDQNYRLSAHDPDPLEDKGLWDVKFAPELIAKIKRSTLPHRFNQAYMCVCRDDEQARCKIEWVESCKDLGRGMPFPLKKYDGPYMTACGVDFGIGQTDKHDKTAFMTIELYPDGRRRILDIQTGRWEGPVIVDKIIDISRRFDPIFMVESNAAQAWIKQFTYERNKSVPVRCKPTGKDKYFLIEGLFVEIQNAAWIMPCDASGRLHPEMAELTKELLYYNPDKHTPDVIIAMMLAREQARQMGNGKLQGKNGGPPLRGLAANLLAR